MWLSVWLAEAIGAFAGQISNVFRNLEDVPAISMHSAIHSLFLKIDPFALWFQWSSGYRPRMQSVQRRFGKLLPRTADESQVAILLKDFDEADRMLAKV